MELRTYEEAGTDAGSVSWRHLGIHAEGSVSIGLFGAKARAYERTNEMLALNEQGCHEQL